MPAEGFLVDALGQPDDLLRGELVKRLADPARQVQAAQAQFFGAISHEHSGSARLGHDADAIARRRIAEGESIENYETRRRRKDGSDLDVALTISPLKNDRGQIIGETVLPSQRVMNFAMRVMANLSDGPDGDRQDRLFHLMQRIARAA